MKAKKLPLFRQPDAKRLVTEACTRHGTTIRLLEQLVDLQRDHVGAARRDGLNDEVDAIFGDYLEM